MTLVDRHCPVCNQRDATPFWQKEDMHLVQCGGCSMVFASPVMEKFISGEYYEDAGRPFYLSEAKLQADFASVRFDRELRFFRKHCKAGKVLDVGCSTGAFLFQLRTRFPDQYETWGTDVSGPAVEHARATGSNIYPGDFLTGGQNGEQFDAITFWAVLEHVANPAKFLGRAHNLLKPGGLCFILVPNFNSLATRVLGTKYRYILPQHINYFTARTLNLLVADIWEPISLTTTHFNPIVIWQDLRGKEMPQDADRAALLKKTTKMKQSAFLLPVRLMYGFSERILQSGGMADNLLLVARKRGANGSIVKI